MQVQVQVQVGMGLAAREWRRVAVLGGRGAQVQVHGTGTGTSRAQQPDSKDPRDWVGVIRVGYTPRTQGSAAGWPGGTPQVAGSSTTVVPLTTYACE